MRNFDEMRDKIAIELILQRGGAKVPREIPTGTTTEEILGGRGATEASVYIRYDKLKHGEYVAEPREINHMRGNVLETFRFSEDGRLIEVETIDTDA